MKPYQDDWRNSALCAQVGPEQMRGALSWWLEHTAAPDKEVSHG